jgi:hypothetical protein
MTGGFTPGTAAGGPLSQLMQGTRAMHPSRSPASGAAHRAAYSPPGASPGDKSVASTARGPVIPAYAFSPRDFLSGR